LSPGEHRSINDFEMIVKVGQGSFGVVRKCKSYLDGRVYAIKTITLPS
jgi:serine/threonine protein kinase